MRNTAQRQIQEMGGWSQELSEKEEMQGGTFSLAWSCRYLLTGASPSSRDAEPLSEAFAAGL